MRLREYIDKSFDQESHKARLMRAINFAKDNEDMEQVVALIASASQEMENDDLMQVQQIFDKKWGIMSSQKRKIQGPGGVDKISTWGAGQ